MSYYGRNKIDIIFSNSGSIDLSGITATPADVSASKKFMDSEGELKDGTLANYDGSYTVTENGTIAIAGKKATQDIVVNIDVVDNPITASTDAEMIALKTADNLFRVIQFYGTSETYENGAFYQVLARPVPPGGYSLARISAKVAAKTITANGSYYASEEGLDGYSNLTVNVPSANPVEVATEAEMTALLVAENVGKVYKFTGTTGTYDNGEIYIVEVSE